MKFIFADSLDVVDPDYDFNNDKSPAGRRAYWDDVFPHEILGFAPYHGMLVSRATVGGRQINGIYTAAQAMRFHKVGARAFLRLDTPHFATLDIFGDSGAFSYIKQEVPPYKPEDMVEFYDRGGFTHGCSVDHIISEFDISAKGMRDGSEEARFRYDINLENASAFFNATKSLSARFTPIGVIQAWSPTSMAEAARSLVAMGYLYLAVGGMAPLRVEQIRQALVSIRAVIPTHVQLHIPGLAKADEIDGINAYGINSFDTSSPLLRAFVSENSNYLMPAGHRNICYYTAIRVPTANANSKLLNAVKMGKFRIEELLKLESSALKYLRAYDQNEADLEQTVSAVLEYSAPLITGLPYDEAYNSSVMKRLCERYRSVLAAAPWKECRCLICQTIGIEVIILRGSNRNRRRGIHNLAVYKSYIDEMGKPQTHI